MTKWSERVSWVGRDFQALLIRLFSLHQKAINIRYRNPNPRSVFGVRLYKNALQTQGVCGTIIIQHRAIKYDVSNFHFSFLLQSVDFSLAEFSDYVTSTDCYLWSHVEQEAHICLSIYDGPGTELDIQRSMYWQTAGLTRNLKFREASHLLFHTFCAVKRHGLIICRSLMSSH